MKFLKLHYKEGGREFLINAAIIAGVEINGTFEKGSILTLTTLDAKGEQKYETAEETFTEIEGVLLG